MFKTDIGPYELHSVLSLPIVGEIMASLQDYNISPPVRTELETVLENWYYGLPEGRERYRQCNLALHYNLTSLFKISQSFIFHGGFSGCVRVAFEPLQLVLDVFQACLFGMKLLLLFPRKVLSVGPWICLSRGSWLRGCLGWMHFSSGHALPLVRCCI